MAIAGTDAAFLPQETIRRKRDGLALPPAEIAAFVDGIAAGTIDDSQVAAFAMAVYFTGMTRAECVALTLAMRDSGEVLDWRGPGLRLDLPGPLLDKHSTGGVGDLVSLVLGPMVAACGGYVPMISGRGLGHTGGTLDKLQAIPGYDIAPGIDRLRRAVRDAGVAIVGQSARLAPADRSLYRIRDVTATVDSVPMITSSILSKKLAAGLDALVMDVKVGGGAFMPTLARATGLAESLVEVGCGAGLPTSALLTAMDEPLAPCAGNAIEIRCAIDYLTGARRPARLHEVTMALGARLLAMGRLAADETAARRTLAAALDDGRAAERFARMVAALGGPAGLLDAPARHLASAPCVLDVPAPEEGFVTACDGRALGMAVVGLGGGRRLPSDTVDPRVGLDRLAAIGDRVARGQPLARVHARSDADAARAAGHVLAAYRLGPAPVTAARAVLGQVGASGLQ